MQQEQLQKIVEGTLGGNYNFECSDVISNQIIDTMVNLNHEVGIIFKEDVLYESFKVEAYLSFYAKLSRHSSIVVEEAITTMHLHDLRFVRISKLNYSQKRRVSIAREIIQDRHLIFIQEPLSNLDDDSMGIVIQWVENLAKFHKKVMTTSISLKHLYLLPGEHYYADEKEIITVHNNDIIQEDIHDSILEKISARCEDKILLFHPKEIDFVESMNGKSYLNVRQSSFVCTSTLDELETKLKRYGFYRSHRSYLVNMQKVQEVVKWTRNSYSLKLEGIENVNIPLSKGRVEGLKDLYQL